MYRRLASLLALTLAATTAHAQNQATIHGFDNSQNPPLETYQGDYLDDENIFHFGLKVTLQADEKALIFARLHIEPGDPNGVHVGSGVVQALQQTHHNLRPVEDLPVAEAGSITMPTEYELEGPEEDPIGVEPSRISAFLAAHAANDFANVGIGSGPGDYWLVEDPNLPTDPAAESRAWGQPGVWDENNGHVGHISTLIHNTFEQSIYQLYGYPTGNNPYSGMSLMTDYINENVTAVLTFTVVVVNPQSKKIKVKAPVRIRRRSVKQGDDPAAMVEEGIPGWFHTVLSVPIHVAEQNGSIVVPAGSLISNARLSWPCTACSSAPFLTCTQINSNTKRPEFHLPATLKNDLAGMGMFPIAFLHTSGDNPQPIPALYPWSGVALIATLPIIVPQSN